MARQIDASGYHAFLKREVGYYAFLKREPCIITGRAGVDIAHIRLPIRRGPIHLPRVERLLDMTHRGHAGIRAFYAVPLVPELHRAEYPGSIHHYADEAAFFAAHGLSMAEVYAQVAQYIARYFVLSDPQEKTP